MNIVLISGKVLEIDFNFIYDKNKKQKHTSIAICKVELDNGNFIHAYGYDEMADMLYKERIEYVYLEGKLDTNMMLEIMRIDILDRDVKKFTKNRQVKS